LAKIFEYTELFSEKCILIKEENFVKY